MKQKKRKDDPNKLPENFRNLILSEDYDSIKDIFKTRSLEAVYGYEDITAVFFARDMPDEMVEWMAEQGADMNARNKWGQTPLHFIISFTGYQPLRTVKLLIRLAR